jgi:hypothetical protein
MAAKPAGMSALSTQRASGDGISVELVAPSPVIIQQVTQ